MNQRLARTGIVCPAILGLMLATCTSRETGTPAATSSAPLAAPDGRPLRAVTLPDVSKMAMSAQTQIREAYSSVMRVTEQRGTSPVEMGRAFGDMGKLLMAAQYNDSAEVCFLNAQTLDPTDFRWPYYLAHLYRTEGDLPKARPLFERALQLKPDDVDALIWLGNLYLSAGEPDAARVQYEKALAREPKSTSARFGLGRAALAKNDARTAVTYLEDVLKMDPTAAGAHYPLSLAYRAIGNEAKAREHLAQRREREILPADPLMVELETLVQSPQTYETLGIRALERKDWTAARAAFRKGLELAPSDPALTFRLGTVESMMGHEREAEALFEEVVRASPEYFPAQYSLGVVLQSKGAHGAAVEHFSAAIAQRPDYHEAHLRLAVSLRHLGRTEDALSHYKQVMTASPSIVEAPLGYAMTLAQLRRYVEARDTLVVATRDHPQDPMLGHALARLLATAPDDRVRDGTRALTIVQDLLQRGRTIDLGATMAMALAELGRFDQATTLQQDLIAAARRAGLAEVADRLTINLARYQRNEPCRTPWSAEEMP
jgi:tetratricopeptide (TPR) repeat protein